MTDWYYHDPAQGRVGPLTAEQLRTHYGQRRLQRDTLVWHEGMREWQPLERCSEELQLDGVVQDTSQPPPLPLPSQAQATRTSASGYPAQPQASGPPPRGLSGCAIAAIVLAVVAVPVVGILAAIAIPAYQDYTIRAKLGAGVTAVAPMMQQAVTEHLDRHGRCPGNRDLAALLQQLTAAGQATTVQFGALGNGNCAFEFTVRGVAADVDGKTWLYELHRSGDIRTWDCSGGDLPARYRPPACRAR